MKLRLRGNSVRVRMDQQDLAALLISGRALDMVRFGPGRDRTFTYEVKVGRAPRNRPQVEYIGGHLVITIDRQCAEGWSNSDRVGFDHRQGTADGSGIRVIVEKDFACLDRPAGEESDDAWAFPNLTSPAAC